MDLVATRVIVPPSLEFTKDRATAYGMFSVKKRAQPTVAGAAFLCSLSEDPRKADADGSWPPASVGIFPDAHLLRRCGMVHCHSRRLTRRPSTPRNIPSQVASTRDDAVGHLKAMTRHPLR